MAAHTSQPNRDIPLQRYRVREPGYARVISNDRLTPEGAADVRHIVLDLEGLDFPYLEGQSLGVLTPGVDDHNHPNKLRLYSIASGRSGEPGRPKSLALCIKRVIRRDPVSGQEIRGPASNFLCDVQPGDQIAITGPVGKTLLLPEDPTSNLILIATGTGIAPFRAFLHHIFRERNDWTGQVRLIAGFRSSDECLYRDEIESYLDHPGFRASFALSREQSTPDGQRTHVNHLVEEQADELWALLGDKKTHLYLCGLKGMEPPIEQVFERLAQRDGLSWPEFRQSLLESGRLRIETY